MKARTQKPRLLAYLKKHQKGITTLEAAVNLLMCRLSERIRELEADGHAIKRTREKTDGGATVTRYKLKR